MSLKDKLANAGSTYTNWDGATPNTNAGATKQSLLHADGNNEKHGYSTSGDYFPVVNGANNSYVNGGSFPLPQPSNLDMAGGAKLSTPTFTQPHDPRQGFNYDDLGPSDGRY